MKAGWRLAFIIGLFVFGYYSRAICWFPLSIQAGACAAVFMYMGFLLKKTKDYLAAVPVEAKIITGIAAAFIWMEFIIGFKSFWLVHCDIGRGIIDIVGCICACSIVVFLSRIIDRKTGFIAGILSFFGKYSLFILCIHIVELKFVPWRMMTGMLISHGMPPGMELTVIIAGKLILDLTLTFALSKIPAVKRLFGMNAA